MIKFFFIVEEPSLGSSLKEETNLKIMIWARDSVHQHYYDKVIFAFQDTDLLGCLLRPRV